MQTYGYEPVKTQLGFGDQMSFVFYEFPINILRMLAWWTRESFLNRVGRNLPSERVVTEKEALARQQKGSTV